MKTNQCCIARSCGLKGELYAARLAFMAVLDQYTLADAASSAPAFPRRPDGDTPSATTESTS
jgi:Rrf2 family nitric oxide-sensitive transcriptional repressor